MSVSQHDIKSYYWIHSLNGCKGFMDQIKGVQDQEMLRTTGLECAFQL